MNIIAYGSLMDGRSLEKTLQRPAQLQKITLPNYQRIFNAPFDDYAFLNLKPNNGSKIEAAFFTLEKNELSLFADREAGSYLREVAPAYYAFVWPEDRCVELPVLHSYKDLCEAAANSLGINFSLGLIEPLAMRDDRLQPLYT